MPILVISDVHANLPALQTVLSAAGHVDAIWCLGDIVGYGPCPNECVQRMQELGAISLLGNHDLASLGELDLSSFNPLARRASEWTAEQLSAKSRAYLSALPPMQRIDGQVTLAHASPRAPVWEYLLEPEAAQDCLAYFDTPICFVGHTHVPLIFVSSSKRAPTRSIPRDKETLRIERNKRYIINPGSVGQPRDGDPQAAFAIIEPEQSRVTFHRVPYDIEKTQALMKQAGLPELLGARLSTGS